jgi:hypothetical protein
VSDRERIEDRKPEAGRGGTSQRTLLLILIIAGLALAGGAAFLLFGLRGSSPASPFLFADVTDATGIAFRHFDGSTGKYHIVETYASGLCLFDYDGDGDDDIYFLSGAPLDAVVEPPPANALYRNDGHMKFTDVTKAARVGDTGFGLGVCAGDYDNDGDLDLYVANYGPDVLYRNEGDGTFTDVTKAAGIGDDRCGAGCAFLDIEADGDLDLYVANYLTFSIAESRPDHRGDIPLYHPPEIYKPQADVLYRNEGDGKFTDISAESGIASKVSWGMGIVCADYDDDGDTDIFVANDVAANFLWRNDGKGKFEEVAFAAGTAVDFNGDEQGSMGVDCGDLDNDGDIDFYQTCYATQIPCTFENQGGGIFADVSLPWGTSEHHLGKVSWGCNLGDFDDDGNLDIFVAAGHVHDKIDLITSAQRYKETNLLYRNLGGRRFREVSASSGPGLAVRESSRGSGIGDLDGDGDLDVVVQNSRSRPTVLRNDSPGENHWIEILTRGTRSNRSGIGARIRLTSGGVTRAAEVHSGRSYQSCYGLRVHFGLGRSATVERIEVRWPSGAVDVLTGVPADRVIEVVEESSPAPRT